MNAERLLVHFETIAEAPDAVARLRRFILELAVRGKLVPQDSSDEPASELLKRIAMEKARLVKLGKVKKSEVESLAADEEPHVLPGNWAWTRLGSIGDWGAGSTPSRGNTELYGGSVTWLKSGELNDNVALAGSEETLTEVAIKKGAFRVNKPGDVLIAMYGATIGKLAILAEVAVTNQAVCGCTPFAGVDNRFLFLFLLSYRPQFHAASEGGAQPNISKVKITGTPFPLPPLAEQNRIVAKVDELMELCDRLETTRMTRETIRDRLAAASLARLNASDPETFQANARFTLAALPELTARPELIKAMRQTVLSMAMSGKLVPQDAKDEPASKLLKRITSLRTRLIEAGKIRRTREIEPVSDAERHFDVPMGWEVTRLTNVYDVRDGTHDTPRYVDDGVPLITSKNLSSGRLSFDETKLISEKDHQKIAERSKVDRDDVLLAMIGSIGNPVIVDTDLPFSIKNVALFKYYDRELSSPAFLRYFLQNAALQMRYSATGGLQPFVSLGFLRAYPIALPPLDEQVRISAKIDELMKLCDQLETSLIANATTRRRLLDAILVDALNPVSQELEAAE